MNERIRELAARAGFDAVAMEVFNLEQDLEKFAELIVEECVRYFNEDYQRDFETLWREDLSNGIKQHFGVEL